MPNTSVPTNAVTCQLLHDPGWRLNRLYSNFATITRPDGSRHCSYFGFDDLSVARKYHESLGPNYRSELRRAKRLAKAWEIKVWGLTTEACFDLLRRIHRESS